MQIKRQRQLCRPPPCSSIDERLTTEGQISRRLCHDLGRSRPRCDTSRCRFASSLPHLQQAKAVALDVVMAYWSAIDENRPILFRQLEQAEGSPTIVLNQKLSKDFVEVLYLALQSNAVCPCPFNVDHKKRQFCRPFPSLVVGVRLQGLKSSVTRHGISPTSQLR